MRLCLILPYLNSFLPLKHHKQIPLCFWSHIPWCVAVIYIWDLLFPKREYDSLSLFDVHPYALFRLTAGYDCASIFFSQCPWIRAVTAHMPFCVWMETGHCREDKLLLVLLVIEWHGWRVKVDWRKTQQHQKSMPKELFIPYTNTQPIYSAEGNQQTQGHKTLKILAQNLITFLISF